MVEQEKGVSLSAGFDQEYSNLIHRCERCDVSQRLGE